jgi:hypothetical protein
MLEKLRRRPKGKEAAHKKRSDQGSDPKPRYRIRRKIPLPSLEGPRGKFKLQEQQLAMAFLGRSRVEASPFLKWAGGKASLIRQLEEFFPHEIDRYIEPFVGGGAVFFHLKFRFPDMRALLRDGNKELINAYRAVRDRPEELMGAEVAEPEGDDFGIGAMGGKGEVRQSEFDADEVASEADAGDGGGAAAEEGVEDEVAGVGGGEDAAFDEGDGFLGGVFAVGFFGVARSGHRPYGR